MTDLASSQARLASLRRRWEEDRSSRVFLQLAEEYRRLGQPADAVQVLEAGLATQPGYLAARVALGRCRLELGHHAAAAEILQQAIAQDPTQLVATKLLVHSRLGLGDPTAAAELLDRYALLNSSDPEIPGLRAQVQRLAAEGGGRAVEAVVDTAAVRTTWSAGQGREAGDAVRASGSQRMPSRDDAATRLAAIAASTAVPEDPQSEAATSSTSPPDVSPPDDAAAAKRLDRRAALSSPSEGVVFVLPAPHHALPDLGRLRPRRRTAQIGLGDPFPQLRAVPPAAAAALFGTIFSVPRAPAAPSPPLPGLPVGPTPLAVEVAHGAAPAIAAPTFPYTEPGPGGEPRSADAVAELASELAPVAAQQPALGSPASGFDAELVAPPAEVAGDIELLGHEAAGGEPETTAWSEPAPTEPAWPALDVVPEAVSAFALERSAPELAADAAAPWDQALLQPEPELGPAALADVPAAALPPGSEGEPEPAEPPVTATLGELYLRQGHLVEAESIFRAVLDRQPEHTAAHAGLAEIERRRRRPLEASELLAGFRGPGGLTAKKSHLLQSYLGRLRQGA